MAASSADAAPAVASRPSQLALGHLLEWADGVESAVQVANHMSNAIAGGLSDPLIARLARHAGNTTNQNCNQNMRALLEELGLMALITEIPDSPRWTHVIKPSALIAYFAQNRPADMKECLGCDLDNTTAFWRDWFKSKKRVEMAQSHELLRGKTAEDLYTTVPLAVHEDAGPITKRLSANCLTFSSLLATAPEKRSRLLLATTERDKAGNDYAAWNVILADLRELSTGEVGGPTGGKDP